MITIGYNTLLDKPDLLAEFLVLAPALSYTELSRRFGISTDRAQFYCLRYGIAKVLPARTSLRAVRLCHYPAILELIGAGSSLREISTALSLTIRSLRIEILKIRRNGLGKRIKQLKESKGLHPDRSIKAQLLKFGLWPEKGTTPGPRYSPSSQASKPSAPLQSAPQQPQAHATAPQLPQKNAQLTLESES